MLSNAFSRRIRWPLAAFGLAVGGLAHAGSPGGAIDFVARTVGEYLTKSMGQSIVVENRTGAGGTVGMDGVMRSPPMTKAIGRNMLAM